MYIEAWTTPSHDASLILEAYSGLRSRRAVAVLLNVQFGHPWCVSGTSSWFALSFAMRPYTAAPVLHHEHITVEIGDPLPPFHRQLQIAERVADEGLDLAPEETWVFVSEVGRAGITELRVASDFLEFMKQGVELALVERIGELADEIRGSQQTCLGVGPGVVLVLRHRKSRQLDRATESDPS